MDTITTDSGKVLKLEEAWVMDNDQTGNYFPGIVKYKRVWVLVEQTSED